MATRKNNSSKTASTASTATPSSARKSRARRSSSRVGKDSTASASRVASRGFDVAKYIGPGAAVLATGALAAAGYVVRDHLAEVVLATLKSATKSGIKAATITTKAFEGATDGAMNAAERVSDTVSMDSLLRYAGLQRRSPVLSVVSPAIGVLCGFIAGSAATYFFGPKLLERFKQEESEHSDESDAKADSVRQPTRSAQDGTPGVDQAPANGGLHGRMS